MDHPFAPGGPTTTVANTAVQLLPGAGQTFRLRNLSTAAQYLSWGASSSVTCTAPTAGTPQLNTIAVAASAVEKISGIQQAQWWISSAATGFEITQGDGL